jgi:hypothetical protein
MYPVPVILAIVIWLLIFLSTGWRIMLYFLVVFVSGVGFRGITWKIVRSLM